jgi:hypothetical protein
MPLSWNLEDDILNQFQHLAQGPAGAGLDAVSSDFYPAQLRRRTAQLKSFIGCSRK